MAHVEHTSTDDDLVVRVSAALLTELDRRAAAAGVSRSEAARVLLDRALSSADDDGVDRTQITQRLALSPAERLRRMVEETRRLQALAGRAT